jgi:iron complex transport system substrate-binding protein
VGDYQTTDWETISRLRPKVIITHYGTGKTPAGFVEHAQAIGATQFNLLTETLNGPDPDSTIYHAIDELGKACQEPQKAAEASARLRGRLDEVARRASSHAKVTALIVIGSEGTMVAGRDSYLSELLDLAGGTNAAAGLNARYPNLDWEQILALKPEVIFQLLPRASDQITDQAKKSWSGLAEVPAVKNGRVVQLTAWYVMLPGYHVADVAEQFEQALHSQHAANN